jgi:hypothetical protein
MAGRPRSAELVVQNHLPWRFYEDPDRACCGLTRAQVEETLRATDGWLRVQNVDYHLWVQPRPNRTDFCITLRLVRQENPPVCVVFKRPSRKRGPSRLRAAKAAARGGSGGVQVAGGSIDP